MRQAALQGGRRFDELRQRPGAIRQCCRAAQRRQPAPVHRRALVRCRIDVIAERRTQCRFITFVHLDLVDQRWPQLATAALQQVRQCTDFCLQPVGLAPCVVVAGAGFGFGCAGGADICFRLADLAFKLARRGQCHFGGVGKLLAIALDHIARQQRIAFAGSFSQLALQPRDAAAMLINGPQHGIAPRGEFGEPGIGFIGGLLRPRQRFGRGLQCHRGFSPDFGVGALRLLQQLVFAAQFRQHAAGVVQQFLLA